MWIFVWCFRVFLGICSQTLASLSHNLWSLLSFPSYTVAIQFRGKEEGLLYIILSFDACSSNTHFSLFKAQCGLKWIKWHPHPFFLQLMEFCGSGLEIGIRVFFGYPHWKFVDPSFLGINICVILNFGFHTEWMAVSSFWGE